MSYVYIPEENLSLILRIAANNFDFGTFSDWESKTVANLLYQSSMCEVFKYDSISFLTLDHISSPYQWLFYYHQLANACRIVQTMPETLDLTALEYFDSSGWSKNVNTARLKKDAVLALKELAKLATFPELDKEWLLFFKLLKQHKLGYKSLNSYGSLIHYDETKNALFTSESINIEYYDILNVTISEEGYEKVKHLDKIHFDNYTSYFIAKSLYGNALNK